MNKILPKFLMLIAVISCLSVSKTLGQVLITDTAHAATMVEKLIGTGLSYSNPVLICDSNAKGIFTVINSNLGLDSGIILTSGRAATDPVNGIDGANGPQQNLFPAHCVPDNPENPFNNDGDPDLDTLGTNTTFDACVLEFDFVPDGDSLLFEYKFGSEEYDNFSCSNVNDVFGFFLSGPGIVGAPNIAYIPGTNIPVSINSTTDPAITQPWSTALCTAMGPGSPFAQYYFDNQNGQTVSYYGMTTVLTARAAVIPCTTYHIKIAIADAGDCTLDSGVFLEANSFRSTNIKLSLNSNLGNGYNYLVEGCTQGELKLKRTTAFPIPQTVHLSYTGNALRNVDYGTVPDSVVIPANDTVTSFIINPIADNIDEGSEFMVVNVLNPCNGAVIDSIIFPIHDYLPMQLMSDDTSSCGKTAVRLEVSGDPGFNYFWRGVPAAPITNPGGMLTEGFPDTTTTFYVSAVYMSCVSDTQSFVATIEPEPIVDIWTEDTTICLSKPMQIRATVGPDYFTQYTYTWGPNLGLDDPFVMEPYYFYATPADYKYILAVQTPLGCTGKDSIIIRSKPSAELINVTPDQRIKYGESVQLNAEGANYYVWNPTKFLDFPTVQDPVSTPTDTVTYQVIGVNEFGCKDTAYVKIDIDYNMVEIVPNAFTPNGDGRNDVFRIKNLRYQKLQEFRVFNRYGQEVFSTTNPEDGWDGTFNGVAQEIGVYHYLVRIAVPGGQTKTYKGDISLLR